MMDQVFQTDAADWRGMGVVPGSGLTIRPAYEAFDADRRFEVDPGPTLEHRGCLCGDVLRGTVEPTDCPLFGTACTPVRPIGPCMVSAEGACAAYYQFARELV
jgi:hydrogenase expression/formation protein HypD